MAFTNQCVVCPVCLIVVIMCLILMYRVEQISVILDNFYVNSCEMFVLVFLLLDLRSIVIGVGTSPVD